MDLLTELRLQRRAAWQKYLSVRGRIGGEYSRIYHYHIRKTAGTSLNSAFLNAFGIDYEQLERCRRGRKGGLVFAQHNRPVIKRGRFFYASSHASAHEVKPPPHTFTVTVLRDPVDRLLSHYRYLMSIKSDPQVRQQEARWMKTLQREMAWLGDSFADFLTHIPREHLQRQLYTFSAQYDVEEATQAILALSAVCFTETFGADLERLARRLDLPLRLRHERRSTPLPQPPPADLERARTLLAPEIELLKSVRAQLAATRPAGA